MQRKPEQVEPGQVWKDNDYRTKGSGEFTVLDVYIAVVNHRQNGPHEVEFAKVRREDGRRTRISTSRLLNDNTSRGYSYIGKSK